MVSLWGKDPLCIWTNAFRLFYLHKVLLYSRWLQIYGTFQSWIHKLQPLTSLRNLGQCFVTSLFILSVSWKQIPTKNVWWTRATIYLDLEEGKSQDFSGKYITFLIHLFRRCPGADLVDSTIWLLMATMMATIDVSMPLDKNIDSDVIEPQLVYDNQFFRWGVYLFD